MFVAPKGPLITVSLSSDKCHFFGLFSYTEAEFLALLSNGEYLRIMRMHMFVSPSDSGTWKQNKDGVVTLSSRYKFRDVEFGSLTFYMANDKSLTNFKKLKMELSKFLQHSPLKEFSPEAVSSIGGRSSYKDTGVFLGDITIDPEIAYVKKIVPRSDLEGLLRSMNEYEVATNKNEFRFIPLKYEHWIFLEWQNAELPNARDRKQMVLELAKLEKDEMPPYYFVEISQEVFEKEAGTTQPFMFYKEMNKNRPHNQEATQKITFPCSSPKH